MSAAASVALCPNEPAKISEIRGARKRVGVEQDRTDDVLRCGRSTEIVLGRVNEHRRGARQCFQHEPLTHAECAQSDTDCVDAREESHCDAVILAGRIDGAVP